MRVRHKLPTFTAERFTGERPWPAGVEEDAKGQPTVRTAHRLLVRLQTGMWLVYDDYGNHEKPCTQAEFERSWESC